MSLNVGGLYVRADKGITRARVVAAISAYWTKLGAHRYTGDALALEPLSLEKTGKLGFVVSSPEKRAHTSWIAIYDSERYRADPALARQLSLDLGVPVAHFEMSGASNQAYYKVYGGGPKPERSSWDSIETFVAETFPYSFLYFNKLREEDIALDEAFEVFAFAGIPPRPKAKYSGPTEERLSKEEELEEAKRLGEAGDAVGLRALLTRAPHVISVVRDRVKYANDPDFVLAFANECAEDSWTNREVAVAALKKRDLALFRRAFAIDDDEENFVLWESSAHDFLKAGSREAAHLIFDAIVGRPAASPRAWHGWVHTLEAKTPSDEINARLEKAEATGVKNPNVLHDLACVWTRFGDRERAIACVEKAVEYGYAHIEQLRADDDLASLREHPRFVAAFSARRSFDLGTLDTTMMIRKTSRRVMRPVLGMFFYFTTPLRELGPAVAAAIERYLEHIAPAKLGFYKHGHWKKLDKAGMTRNLNKLRKPPAGHVLVRVAMRDVDGDATDSSFDTAVWEENDRVSELCFTYPRTIDPELAYERFVELAMLLPAEAGSAGYTLSERDNCNVYEGVSWDSASVYQRFLGFERHPMREWGRGSATAHWLTLLDDALIEKCGGVATLTKAVGEAKLTKVGGAVVIRAARRPPIGLATDPVDIGALPSVAKAIAKVRMDSNDADACAAYARFDKLAPLAYENGS